MRIMVFDVPAETGGALTILKEFYYEALVDKENEWIFVVSIPKLEEKDNIKVINYPWVKRSWLHRFFFDNFVAYKLVAKHDVDTILSLQNLVIPKTYVKQIVYLHQALPFVEKRYSIKENLKFWIYQNIISRMIFKSIKQADKIMVQTMWIMDAAIEKTGVSRKKFILKQPETNIKVKNYYKHIGSKRIFFYPASGFSYKNHEIIVKACQSLNIKGINNYEVVFTLRGDENNSIANLRKTIEKDNLPIKFIGSINLIQVYEYYAKSVLVFPSYIETFGLPLLEAKLHQAPIIASDCAFSHEILDGYDKVHYFNPFKFQHLEEHLKKYIILN